MNKTAKTIIAAVALIVLVAGAAALYKRLAPNYAPDSLAPSSSPASGHEAQSGGGQEGGEQGSGEALQEALDFTVTDSGGAEVSLSSLRGKPVVINFWATWCGYCTQEMPDFDEVYAEYGDRVSFMMVNVTEDSRSETVEKAQDFIDEKDYAFPVYFDTLGDAKAKYGVNGIPITVVVDEKGYVYGYANGMITGDVLRGALDEVIALYQI